jgi:subtilase-type serine protease
MGHADAQTSPSSFDTAEYYASGALAQIHADEAYALGYTGAGVTVALFDTGLDPTNPEFAGKTLSGYDYLFDTTDLTDLSGHGTHDAGTIAANRDGVGMQGVAYGANVMSFNILSSFDVLETNTEFFDGLQRAVDAGVRIASNSWVTFVGFYGQDYLNYIHDNLKSAEDHGMIFVFAAGNFSDTKPWDLADLPETMPDLQKQFIAVVAVDANNQIASFSNRCGIDAAWCIAAPGVDIYSTVPTGTGIGPGGNYDYMSGTSMAAPVVSGAVALVLQAFPYMTSEQIVQTVLTTATPIGDPSIYGHGLLNVGAAVQGPGSFDMDWAVDTAGYNSTWSNNISGTGALTKSGNGILVLNGHDTYRGPTIIDGGTLQIGDAAHSTASIASNVRVRAHGTLSGHGTINGNTVNNGTVSPGGSIGTLTVKGDYTQGANGVLDIAIGPNGASELAVTGNASLGGTLDLQYASGTYLASVNTLLSAGNITGQFSTVVDNGAPGLMHFFTATQKQLDLTLQPANDVVVTSLTTAAIDNAHQSDGNILSRVAHRADAGARGGIWATMQGQFAQYDSDAGGPDFSTRTAGFLGGIDHRYDSGLMLGLAGGFSRLDLDQTFARANGNADLYNVALYGGYAVDTFSLAASVGYTQGRFKTHRTFQAVTGQMSPNSSYDGQVISGAVEAAEHLSAGMLSLTPSAGLDYVYLRRDSGSESGAPSFDLTFASDSTDSLRPYAGAELSANYLTGDNAQITPSMRIRYSHEVLSTDRRVTASLVRGSNALQKVGLSPARDLVTVGGGLKVQIDGTLDLHVDAELTLPTGNYASQAVSAGLDYRF